MMSPESPEALEFDRKVTALDALHSMRDLAALTPDLVRAAINELVPGGEEAAADAELILGYAVLGAELNPNDEEWAAIQERAQKILDRELAG